MRFCTVGFVVLVTSFAGCATEGGTESIGVSGAALAAQPLDPTGPGGEVPAQRTYPAADPVVVGTVGGSPDECGLPGGTNPDPACRLDEDGDGVVARFDCDDRDRAVNPFAIDRYCDGVDQNCNGFDECDRDGDGVLAESDCNDSDPRVQLECRADIAPPGITIM